MTSQKKKYLGGGLIWAALIFGIVLFFNISCGASFPNSKPQMIFQNCQVVNNTAGGEISLRCEQPVKSEDSQDAEDSSALFSVPESDNE